MSAGTCNASAVILKSPVRLISNSRFCRFGVTIFFCSFGALSWPELFATVFVVLIFGFCAGIEIRDLISLAWLIEDGTVGIELIT